MTSTTRSTTPRFEDLTETTGIPVTAEGASMMYTRYEYATRFANGQSVLELGCGAGQGLGLLARSAATVVGGDFSEALLRDARAHYRDRFPLVRLSADHLPFAQGSFDLVLLFEASYYVPDMNRAFDELARVLRPGGRVIFVNANPDRADFISSPHSVHYHSADEFRRALESRGFAVTVEGAYPVQSSSKGGLASRVAGPLFGLARQALELFHLTPKTLRGRARLKRLVNRRLIEVPAELREGFAAVEQRVALPAGSAPGFKVIYVTAQRRA
jgi:SAM-dependent methyltransferase